MNAAHKIPIFFPIETAVRELDYRILLACQCARPDTVIFVGRKDVIFNLALQCRSGIFVGRHIFSLFKKSRKKYALLKERGFSYIFLDEEGAIYRGGPEDWKTALIRRFDPALLDADDHLCNWGKFQADFYASNKPPCANRICVTGHPRFDLCKPAYRGYYAPEVEALRASIGPFILINSNFSPANHALGLEKSFDSKYGFDPLNESVRTRHIRLFSHLSIKLVSFIQLANTLASAFPDHTIVVRPHPGERMNTYTAMLGKIPRIQVRRDGPVIPWLMAADVLVNDGCTTAIEAAHHTPLIINFRPAIDPEFDLQLPQLVGETCRTEDEVLASIKAFVNRGNVQRPHFTPSPLLTSMISNLAEGTDAFQKLKQLLDEIIPEKKAPVINVAWWKENGRESLQQLRFLLGRWQRRSANRQLNDAYDQTKFPGLDRDYLAERVERCCQMLGRKVSHRYHNPSVVTFETES